MNGDIQNGSIFQELEIIGAIIIAEGDGICVMIQI